MIPMLRVSWRANFRGIVWVSVSVGGVSARQKNGPLGPARTTGRMWTGPRRYLLEVSIIITGSAGTTTRLATPTDPTDYSRGDLSAFGARGPARSPAGGARRPPPQGRSRASRRGARARPGRRPARAPR